MTENFASSNIPSPTTSSNASGKNLMSNKDQEMNYIGKNNDINNNNNNNISTSSTLDFDSLTDAEKNDDSPRSLSSTYNDFLNRYNLLVIMLAAMLTAIGLGTGLIAFFTLRARDKRTAKSALVDYTTTQADYLQKELDKSVLISVNLKGLFEVMPNPQFTDFQRFINTTEVRSRNPGINTIAYCPQVAAANVSTLEDEIRLTKSAEYQNFTVFDLDGNFSRVDLPIGMEYYTPLLFSDPYVDLIVGYDIGASVPFKRDAINRARVSLKSAATSKTYFTVPGQGDRPVCEMYCPVLDANNEIQGFSGIAFFISSMVDAAFSNYVLSQVEVYLLDDAEEKDSDGHFLYSTTGETDTVAANRAIRNAPFSVSQTVLMADRQWIAVFLPTKSFLRNNEGYEKWIALFIPLVVCVILSFILALFIKGMEYSSKMRQMAKERVVILETSQQRLQKLLDSIATQEKKTRTIIDTLTDAVIVVNEHGKLLKVNISFEKMFGLNEVEIQHHTLQSIFVDAEDKVLLVDNPMGTDIQAKNQFGKTFPVQVFSQSLVKQPGADEAYVLSVRNLSDKEQMLRDIASQKDRIKNLEEKAEFDGEFAVESFRTDLLEFCKREVNSENIEFLIELLDYKSLAFNLRSERKVVIFNKYCKIGSPQQLNISKEVSDRIEHKIKKSKTADTDLFELVEDMVKAMIVQDIFPRFKKYKESMRRSSSEVSSSDGNSNSNNSRGKNKNKNKNKNDRASESGSPLTPSSPSQHSSNFLPKTGDL